MHPIPAMRVSSRTLLLLAGMQLVSMATPSAVWAQGPAPTPSPVPTVAGNVGSGSTASKNAAIVLVPTGILAMLVGLAIVYVGAADEAGGSEAIGEPPDYNTLAVPGWTTFGLGAAALIGGIVLIATTASTLATPPQTTSPQVSLLSQGGAWKSVPVWREVAPEEKALPPVVGLPLWTGRF